MVKCQRSNAVEIIGPTTGAVSTLVKKYVTIYKTIFNISGEILEMYYFAFFYCIYKASIRHSCICCISPLFCSQCIVEFQVTRSIKQITHANRRPGIFRSLCAWLKCSFGDLKARKSPHTSDGGGCFWVAN